MENAKAIYRIYRTLLRTERHITFKDDPQSVTSAAKWTKKWILENCGKPNFTQEASNLEKMLRCNIARLIPKGPNFKLILPQEVELGPVAYNSKPHCGCSN